MIVESERVVSVVTPLFNSASHIDATLASLQAQTFRDWESILVDDGSTDETPQRVARYLEDQRFRYVRQPNQGIAAARNTGIRSARGTWIALLDHDDRWMPTKLERQLSVVQSTACDIVCSNAVVSRGPERFLFRDWIAPDLRSQVENCVREDIDTFALLIRVNFLCTSSVLVRRSLFETHGLLDTHATPADDYDMWLRCMPSAKICYVTDPLVEYVLHESNYSRDSVLLREKAIYVLFKARRTWSADATRASQCEESLRMHYRLLFEELRKRRQHRSVVRHAVSLAGKGRVGLRVLLPTMRSTIMHPTGTTALR